jgi:peptidoglycan hydrolase-like protein with peptidoglycan-binding domain
MNRTFALVAGMFLGSLTAGNLLAQNTATPKPAAPASTSMQHQPPTVGAKTTQQDTAAVRTSGKSAARHVPWTKDQIKEAQEGLIKAGFYKGEATGMYGKQTRKAIRAYQKANKLPVTGRLSNDLLTRLHSA